MGLYCCCTMSVCCYTMPTCCCTLSTLSFVMRNTTTSLPSHVFAFQNTGGTLALVTSTGCTVRCVVANGERRRRVVKFCLIKEIPHQLTADMPEFLKRIFIPYRCSDEYRSRRRATIRGKMRKKQVDGRYQGPDEIRIINLSGNVKGQFRFQPGDSRYRYLPHLSLLGSGHLVNLATFGSCWPCYPHYPAAARSDTSLDVSR